ncbi:MAG: GNAT family N-acetyltransferase [Candidatus Lokiarchaeota archaeon]|nr:GNAT family N-acetyltransferase [Candidatus Lokiarchaeota archaeon]
MPQSSYSFSDLYELDSSNINMSVKVAMNAFQDDPLFSQLFPDDEIRKKKNPCLFEFAVKFGLRYGQVYSPSEDIEGFCVWEMPESAQWTISRMWRVGAFKVARILGLKFIVQYISGLNIVEKYHKKLAPKNHIYLSLIAVSPEQQGKGVASQLLRPMLKRCDQKQLSSYLETTKEENISLYQHFGYQLVKEIVFPNTTAKVWMMLRNPK